MNMPFYSNTHVVYTIFSLIFSFCLYMPPANANTDMRAFREVQKAIHRDGKINGGKTYRKFARALQNANSKNLLKDSAKFDATVGEHSENFGKGFTWDRKDEEIVLAMFINAADPLGISIDGIKAGDRIQITSASGIGSFSKDKGNPLASSIVGLVSAGAKGATIALGAPHITPIIDKIEGFANEQFKATNAKHKRRDAFGVDPGTGHKARQEGGILVSLPLAGGPFYSGKSKKRWLKSHKPRTDEVRPNHVKNAFFPVRGKFSHNSRTVRGDGQIFVVPWDWKYDDNAGFYKVFMRITRSSKATKPPVVK